MNKLSNKRINFIVINSYKNEQNSLLNLDTKANSQFSFCLFFFSFFHKFYPMTFKEKLLLCNLLCCCFFVRCWNFNLSQCFKLNHHNYITLKKGTWKFLILVDDVAPSSTLLLYKRHSNWFFMLCFLFIPAKECNFIRRAKTTTYLAASSCGNNSDLSSLYIHNHIEGSVPSLVDMDRIYRYKFQPDNRIHSSEEEVALSWAYVEV